MKTNIAFILDKSGSMGSVCEAAISGFNEYVNTLRFSKEDYNFSATLFDTKVQDFCLNQPINAVPALSSLTYRPDGGTALYDAVCSTVKRMQGEPSGLAEKILSFFRPMKPTEASEGMNIVVILTDGQENASTMYNGNDFKKLVESLQATGKWKFVFLGANQDAWANAKQWGFTQDAVSNFNSTVRGTANAFHVSAQSTVNYTSAVARGDVNAIFYSPESKLNLEKTK